MTVKPSLGTHVGPDFQGSHPPLTIAPPPTQPRAVPSRSKRSPCLTLRPLPELLLAPGQITTSTSRARHPSGLGTDTAFPRRSPGALCSGGLCWEPGLLPQPLGHSPCQDWDCPGAQAPGLSCHGCPPSPCVMHRHGQMTNACAGRQNTLPRNIPLWHEDYFEPKATEKKHKHKKSSPPSPYLPPSRT